jgi:hypothetical protein
MRALSKMSSNGLPDATLKITPRDVIRTCLPHVTRADNTPVSRATEW